MAYFRIKPGKMSTAIFAALENKEAGEGPREILPQPHFPIIRLGSQVMIEGKIMQIANPTICKATKGVMDL
jgi:hypothetical protein